MYKTYLQYYVAKEAGATSQLVKQLATGARKSGLWGKVKNFLHPGSSSMITYRGKDLTRGAIGRMNYAQKRKLIRDIRKHGDYLTNNLGGNSNFAPYLQANQAAEFYSRTLRNPNSYTDMQRAFQAAQNSAYLKGMYKYRNTQDAFNAYNNLGKKAPQHLKDRYRNDYTNALNSYNYHAERAGQVSDAIRRQNLFMPVRGQLNTNTFAHTVNNPQFRSSGQMYSFHPAQIASNQFSVPGLNK